MSKLRKRFWCNRGKHRWHVTFWYRNASNYYQCVDCDEPGFEMPYAN